MNLQDTYETGYGAAFTRVDHWDDTYNGETLVAEYAARVTWADGDRWERPEWVNKYVKTLREEMAPMNIYSVNGDKGYVHLYFTR